MDLRPHFIARTSSKGSSISRSDQQRTTQAAQMDLLTKIFTLVVQNPTPNALQDACTFSMLLCVNQALSQALLPAAKGRLLLSWTSRDLRRLDQFNMVTWLQRHVLQHQTMQQLDLLPDLLELELLEYEEHINGYLQLQDGDAFRTSAFCDRVACVLGAAAVVGGLQLPAVKGWVSQGLPAATLSLLPGGHLTQLVLAAPDLDDPSLQELAAITGLQDLRLPVLNPARRRLAPVITPMTRLTRLLLCNPAQAVLDSLPASLLTLELVRWHQTTLQIAQLTALQTLAVLEMAGVSQAHDGDSELDDEPPLPSSGELESASELPPQLRRLVVVGIADAAQLAQVTGLVHLQLTGVPDSYQGVLPGLRSLTQLTRVELLQRFWDATIADVAAWVPLFKGLPLHVPSLRLHVPKSYPLAVDLARLVSALQSLTSLTRLELSRGRVPRAAAILTAAAAAGGNGVGGGVWEATVDQLASMLPASLVELGLSRVPAVAAESGVAAVGGDWLPLLERIAHLSALCSLDVRDMPLGRSVAPLRDAKHLTSLSLFRCKIDDDAFVSAFGPGCTGLVGLQGLTVEGEAYDPLEEPELSTGMLAGMASSHTLQGLRVLQLRGHQLTEDQLQPLVSSLPFLMKLVL